ncbi:hypothetical protein MMC24_006637 [Lignoscripta atroalba]|nr:hypothetical protein [Lignoscripta atroalba]
MLQTRSQAQVYASINVSLCHSRQTDVQARKNSGQLAPGSQDSHSQVLQTDSSCKRKPQPAQRRAQGRTSLRVVAPWFLRPQTRSLSRKEAAWLSEDISSEEDGLRKEKSPSLAPVGCIVVATPDPASCSKTFDDVAEIEEIPGLDSDESWGPILGSTPEKESPVLRGDGGIGFHAGVPIIDSSLSPGTVATPMDISTEVKNLKDERRALIPRLPQFLDVVLTSAAAGEPEKKREESTEYVSRYKQTPEYGKPAQSVNQTDWSAVEQLPQLGVAGSNKSFVTRTDFGPGIPHSIETSISTHAYSVLSGLPLQSQSQWQDRPSVEEPTGHGIISPYSTLEEQLHSRALSPRANLPALPSTASAPVVLPPSSPFTDSATFQLPPAQYMNIGESLEKSFSVFHSPQVAVLFGQSFLSQYSAHHQPQSVTLSSTS